MAITQNPAPVARPGTTVPYNTFVGGFVTEATGLSFPENTCRDIDNCDINISGKVRRRMGLDLEPLGVGLNVPNVPNEENHAVSTWEWNAVGGNPDLNFYVIQSGTRLYILNQDVVPLSTVNNNSLTKTATSYIDLDTADAKWGTTQAEWQSGLLQGCSGAGRFWFTWPYDDPMYLEYDQDTQIITKKYVGQSARFPNGRIWIRDFTGFKLSYDPAIDVTSFASTNEQYQYFYNLITGGWRDVPDIFEYQTNVGGYPGQHWVWFMGKDDSSTGFGEDVLRKNTVQQEPAPRGKQLMSPLRGLRSFNYSRYTSKSPVYIYFPTEGSYLSSYTNPVSANVIVGPDAPSSGFKACAFFAGRLWMAGEQNGIRPGGLYFSKVVAEAEDAGFCAQVNDPTSEDFPDVLDTDGGVIYLSECSGIQRLVPAGQGLLVFANNGVWFVRGGDSGFNANQYSVDKVSSIGTTGPTSIVSFEEVVMYWASGGVYSVQFQAGLAVNAISVTDTVIRRYFQSIPLEAKRLAYGFADELGKRLMWMWREADEYDSSNAMQSYRNRVLVFDLRLGAFYKYSIEFVEGSQLYPLVGLARQKVTFPADTEVVTLNDGVTPVTLSTLENLTVFEEIDGASRDIASNVYIITQVGLSAGTATIYICEFRNLDFVDFESFTGGEDFTSFLETGAQHFGDLGRNKAATYVHSFFQKTESGFYDAGGGVLATKYPSGCQLQGKWDWHVTASGGRWSDSQQAYKLRRPYVPVDSSDTFDTGEEVVYTKRKMRGKGKALALKYTSETSKDFQLLGFAIDVTGNTA